MTTKLIVGKTYRIDHSRKGMFYGQITMLANEWATVFVPPTKASPGKGENMTVKLALAKFTEMKATA